MEVVEFLLDRLCDKKKARQRGQPGSGNERRFIFRDFRTKLRGGGGGGEVRRIYLSRHPDSEMNQGNCKQLPGK